MNLTLHRSDDFRLNFFTAFPTRIELVRLEQKVITQTFITSLHLVPKQLKHGSRHIRMTNDVVLSTNQLA